MKKFIKIVGLIFSIIIGLLLTYVAFTFPPVMAGMAAKTMCSCVFVSGRTPESVREKEFQVFPGLPKAGIAIDEQDSTVEATIFWKTSKAIFRKGLGCTLLSNLPEKAVRDQRIGIAVASPVKDALPWPEGDMVKVSTIKTINQRAIDVALNEAFLDKDPERPKFTSAVVVVYDGQIIGEKYANGIDHNARLMGWSMTKSVVNALIGILVHDGKLKVNASAPVLEWQNDSRKEISLNNLLQATSGLSWSESYFIPTSQFHKMFIHSDDKAAYAASMDLKFKPGERYQYSSGTTNILSRIVRQTVGDSQYYKFPYERLFYKIGMAHALIEPDASGTFVGSSYSYASARDWAKFGLLYLNDGVWNGERILPEGWVKYTTTPSSAATIGEYGAQWHLNAGAKNNPARRKMPTLPGDAYWADGFEEQWIMVIPSRKLVVVRLGISHHGSDFAELVNSILKALPSG